MRALYHYIIAFIFLAAGIPLTYFGYENGVDAAESGDSNDSGYILMMAFGLLFLLLSVKNMTYLIFIILSMKIS